MQQLSRATSSAFSQTYVSVLHLKLVEWCSQYFMYLLTFVILSGAAHIFIQDFCWINMHYPAPHSQDCTQLYGRNAQQNQRHRYLTHLLHFGLFLLILFSLSLCSTYKLSLFHMHSKLLDTVILTYCLANCRKYNSSPHTVQYPVPARYS